MSTKLYLEERLMKTLDIINRKRTVTVEQLAGTFGVSGATIRSDLRELESRGLVVRTHGGAFLRDRRVDAFRNSTVDADYRTRLGRDVELKETIGAAAAALVNDGDNLMIDDGSTTLQVARHLSSQLKATVITNGINICQELSANPRVEVIATGGRFSHDDHSFHGSMAQQAAARFYADKAILGISGLDPDAGLTAPNEPKAELKKIMIDNAKELIIVADHSKLLATSLIPVCSLTRVTTLVTDRKSPAEVLKKLRAHGLAVAVAR